MKFGSGSEIRFWKDIWVGETKLKDDFRTLYSLAIDLKVLVRDCFQLVGNTCQPRLCKSLYDWERGEWCRLLGLLESMRPDPSLQDVWVWCISQKRCYTTKSFYLALSNHDFLEFSHKSIWIFDIPSKVSFFLSGMWF